MGDLDQTTSGTIKISDQKDHQNDDQCGNMGRDLESTLAVHEGYYEREVVVGFERQPF